jgi:hypothetical protein
VPFGAVQDTVAELPVIAEDVNPVGAAMQVYSDEDIDVEYTGPRQLVLLYANAYM